jgi:hypothetical protein
MKKPSRFKQRDVTRAVRGAIAAKLRVDVVEVRPDGTVRMYSGDQFASIPGAAETNEWDDVLTDAAVSK